MSSRTHREWMFWVPIVGCVLAGVIFLISGFTNLGIVFISLVALFLGFALEEIKSPDKAFLFKRGRLAAGDLKPGWHLCVPFLWKIERRSTATQEILLEGEEMYVSTKTPLIVKGGIYYKIVNFTKAISISEEDAKSRIKKVVLAKLKWQIGKKTFAELLDERGDVEGEVLRLSNIDIRPDGYKIVGVEIDDLKEEIESEAERIRKIGAAEAEVAKKKAEALAGPLKDNYPAAIASTMENAVKAFSAWLKKN